MSNYDSKERPILVVLSRSEPVVLDQPNLTQMHVLSSGPEMPATDFDLTQYRKLDGSAELSEQATDAEIAAFVDRQLELQCPKS